MLGFSFIKIDFEDSMSDSDKQDSNNNQKDPSFWGKIWEWLVTSPSFGFLSNFGMNFRIFYEHLNTPQKRDDIVKTFNTVCNCSFFGYST